MSIATEIQRLQEAKADIKEAIENKGVTVSSSLTISDYADLIDSIPTDTTEVESKDVDFYDYDGTRLYSYTKQEFLALNEMPQNPTHEGLISQGWNWSLADAKDYLSDMPYLDIGQYYVTNDNKTRVYISVGNKTLTISVGIGINGTATVEWGDGASSTITGTAVGNPTFATHTYSTSGDYVISISSSSQYRIVGGNTNASYLVCIEQTDSANNILYNCLINKIELSNNCMLGRNALRSCAKLKSITIANTTEIKDSSAMLGTLFEYILCPSSIKGSDNFRDCVNLKHFSISTGLTNTNGLNFGRNNNIKKVALPKSITTLSNYMFQNTGSVEYVKLPNSITAITSRAFYQAYGLKVCDMSTFTSIPTLSVDNLFNSNQDDLQIIVPDSLYDDWIVATNWSNYASYIVKESEYVG